MNTPHIRPGALRVGDVVYYPTQGVGRLIDCKTETIYGTTAEFYVIRFDRDRLTLQVPVQKALANGLYQLTKKRVVDNLTRILRTIAEPRVKSRQMWNRRAAELESKLNSGDLVALAEVMRDTNRDHDEDGEISYSEQQLLKKAALRLADVFVAVEEHQSPTAALQTFNQHLTGAKQLLPIKYW